MFSFSGTLQLHGVSKEINGDFVFEPNGKAVVAKFPLEVSDFNIEIPTYLGVKVSESVDLEILLVLKTKANNE